MTSLFKKIFFLLSILRLVPHWILFNTGSNKEIIRYDTDRWLKIMRNNRSLQTGFLYLMTYFPEFRNLFYYRMGFFSRCFSLLCPQMKTLFITANEIGPGLFIQHGFATIIAAKSIGKDCWINQQVTIGFANTTDHPVIEDNVIISAGAKIIGNVTVGSNCKIGANAVVVKNVPANCTVVGVPAYIVKRDGIRVHEKL